MSLPPNNATLLSGSKRPVPNTETSPSLLNKRLRFQEPDLQIVVGNGETGAQTFHHYSVLLCAASPYFDTMLSCKEMKEAREMKVRFPDKLPEEWERVSQFLEPCHSQQLTAKDIPTLLPWFHELQIDALVHQCEQLVLEKVQHLRKSRNEEQVNDFLQLLEMSAMYNLRKGEEASLAYLQECINRGQIMLGSSGVQRLIPFMRKRPALYAAMKKHLPQEFRNTPADEMLDNPLFAFLVSARWKLRAKKREERRAQRRGPGAGGDPLAANIAAAVAVAVNRRAAEAARAAGAAPNNNQVVNIDD